LRSITSLPSIKSRENAELGRLRLSDSEPEPELSANPNSDPRDFPISSDSVDCDDFRLFNSVRDPRHVDPTVNRELAMKIIRIKRNDPQVKSLRVHGRDYFNEQLWRRLGEILCENTNLEELSVNECNGLGEILDSRLSRLGSMTGLCP